MERRTYFTWIVGMALLFQFCVAPGYYKARMEESNPVTGFVQDVYGFPMGKACRFFDDRSYYIRSYLPILVGFRGASYSASGQTVRRLFPWKNKPTTTGKTW